MRTSRSQVWRDDKSAEFLQRCRNPDFVSEFHFCVGGVSVFRVRVGAEDCECVVAVAVLDAAVRYVSADGEDVSTSLGELDGDRAVHGRPVPVRAIRSFAGQRHYPGLFWSSTTGGHVGYESLLELDRLWLADFDREVAWMRLSHSGCRVNRQCRISFVCRRRVGGLTSSGGEALCTELCYRDEGGECVDTTFKRLTSAG